MRRTAALLLLLTATASAQPWGASVSTVAQSVGDRGTWLESRVLVGGQAGRLGGGVVEAGRVERFGAAAGFVGADLYPDLGRGVSGNVRARVAPGSDITARLDLGAAVTVAMGGGWVASAGARRLAFADQTLHVATATAERYLGAWLLRGAVAVVPDQPRVPLSARVTARRMLGDGGGAFGSFWEVSAGRGEEATVEAAGRSSIRESWSVGARIQRPLVGPLGATLGAGYTADGALSRSHAEVGLFVRW